jgi:hypothetical protein
MKSSNAAAWPRLAPGTWGVFYNTAELQPQRSRSGLNAQPDAPEEFQRQVEAVCTCYHEAPRLGEEEGLPPVRVEERTGIQALERIAPTKPMKPGRAERREFEDERHGTPCLIGNFEVVTGEVIAPTVQATRTEEDVATHLAGTVATDPEAGGIFGADNLTIPCSATLVP